MALPFHKRFHNRSMTSALFRKFLKFQNN